jgi:transcriptional regulator with PAS, ATPase and Fis domain
LFLDEVAGLPLEVQAQLLRAIEQREVISLGASRAAAVDVRFVAATQRPLAQWVSEGRFRADLRARLEGFRVELPPLRQRLGDAPLLFLHLLGCHSPRSPRPEARVLEWLALQQWPLNVREIVLLVRKILATYPEATELTLEQVMAVLSVASAYHPAGDPKPAPSAPRRRVDKRAFRPETVEAFRAALERTSGNVALAAAELEISRQRAYRILRRCSTPPTDRSPS